MQIVNQSVSATGADVVIRRVGSGRTEEDGMSPMREAQIRQRLIDGSYNSASVVDEVARRILRSGDL